MNARAAALGLAGTSFRNACGHDAPGMHTSARDLAVLAGHVLAWPELAALAATGERRLDTLGGRSFRLRTTNAFIGRVPGVMGLKTGYTPRAGRCLVLTGERDGVRVVVVLLGAKERWWDAAAMLERGFDFARARRPP
jgi:D-alanyl-D-alanine carboxypeptidase (penicillin-binding protein 5/6)